MDSEDQNNTEHNEATDAAPAVEEPQQPEGTVKTKKFPLDEGYVEGALEQVKEMVAGNGIDPEAIKIESSEGEIIHFIAETRLNITTKIHKKTMPGRVKGPVQVASDTAANEALSKDYLTLFDDLNIQKEIRDIILKREDKGFAQKGLVFPIPTWKKDYVIFEPCGVCKSTGNVKCQHCHGKGIDHCPNCHGTGQEHCHACHGSRMVAGAQGKKVQCHRCQGRGKIGCTKCGQSGNVQCRICASKGTTQCPNCQGNAFASHLTIVELEGRCEFNYPDDELPEKVVALIEEYGDKIKEHANVELIKEEQVEIIDEEGEEEREARHKILKLPIFYNVVMPYGHIEFEIKDKSYYTFLFGKQALLNHVSPFMDDLLANGMRKIDDAAEGRGGPEENLAQASKYKALRYAMVMAANLPARKALKKLAEKYPYGFKENTQKEILRKILKGYRMITKRSVTMGIGAAMGLSTVLSLCYFALPFRGMIMAKMPNMAVTGVVDALALGVIILAGNFVIKGFASSALGRALQRIMPKQKFKTVATSLGSAPIINALLCTIIFIAVIEASRHVGQINTPLWYLNLFR